VSDELKRKRLRPVTEFEENHETLVMIISHEAHSKWLPGTGTLTFCAASSLTRIDLLQHAQEETAVAYF
jgi:hypothetical protein